MNILIVPNDPSLLNNAIFTKNDPNALNRRYQVLREAGSAEGIRINTIDKGDPSNADAIIYIDPVPIHQDLSMLDETSIASKAYLLLFEPPAVNPLAYRTRFHRRFAGTFIWNTKLNSKPGYHPVRFTINNDRTYTNTEEELICMISGNKYSFDKNELYSKRYYDFRRVANLAGDSAALYGRGWNTPHPVGPTARSIAVRLLLGEFPNIAPKHIAYHLTGRPPLHAYKGSVDDKFETLRRYRFSLVYENGRYPGYITEKIFDSLAAGSIPVYLGPPDITDHIPANVFIDARRFSSIREMHDYLTTISPDEESTLRSEGQEWLQTAAPNIFGVQRFVQDVLGPIKAASKPTQ